MRRSNRRIRNHSEMKCSRHHAHPGSETRARPEGPEDRNRREGAESPGGPREEARELDAGGSGFATGGRACVELDVDEDEHTEDAPEEGVGDAEAPGAAEPEPLIR